MYHSPKRGINAQMVTTMRLLYPSLQCTDKERYYILSKETGGHLYVPKDKKGISRIIESEPLIDYVIIDDTDCLSNDILWKFFVANRKGILYGPILFVGRECQGKYHSSKNVWSMLCNHPDIESYRVKDPEIMEQKDSVTYVADLIQKAKKQASIKNIFLPKLKETDLVKMFIKGVQNG